MFSIIIPIFNSEPYLKSCLNSIEKQSFSDYEIICVDDGSTDTSLEIVKKFNKRNNKIKIKSIKHKNAGVARNKGITEANGDYLIFLDADDYWPTNTLETIFKEIQENNNPDILIFKAKEKNELNNTIRKNKKSLIEENCPKKKVFTPKEIKGKLFNTFNYWLWNKTFKTSFIKNNKITFQDINRSNDVMFVSQSLVKAKTICIIKKYLIIHRIGHGTNMQSNNADEPITFWFAFLETKSKLKETLEKEYSIYEKSYLNSVLKALKDYLYSVAYNTEIYEYVKSYIKNNAEKDFEFLLHKKDYYFDVETYEWYIDLIQNGKEQETASIKRTSLKESFIKLNKSINDNGMKYTINRILYHMNLRKDNDPLRTYNTKK